jgi:acetyl esterase
MADYGRLIDDEVWAFIRRTEAFYPPDAIALSIADQRRVYDTMTAAFHTGRPEGIAVRDLTADCVPCRVYEGADPLASVVYFHGGGFVVGGLDSHDDVCAEIAATTACRVMSVDYRLAPDHRHPAQFDDAWTATAWAAGAFGGSIVLVGDSAGGALAASVAHHARGRLGGIAGQVLIYPGLGGAMDRGSYIDRADAPMLTTADVAFYQDIRCDGPAPVADPRYAALHDNDFSGLPPTVIVTADCDPLRDDGRDYRDRIVAAGGDATWINEDGLVHGYLRARAMSARARASFDRITGAIARMARAG